MAARPRWTRLRSARGVAKNKPQEALNRFMAWVVLVGDALLRLRCFKLCLNATMTTTPSL